MLKLEKKGSLMLKVSQASVTLLSIQKVKCGIISKPLKSQLLKSKSRTMIIRQEMPQHRTLSPQPKHTNALRLFQQLSQKRTPHSIHYLRKSFKPASLWERRHDLSRKNNQRLSPKHRIRKFKKQKIDQKKISSSFQVQFLRNLVKGKVSVKQFLDRGDQSQKPASKTDF